MQAVRTAFGETSLIIKDTARNLQTIKDVLPTFSDQVTTIHDKLPEILDKLAVLDDILPGVKALLEVSSGKFKIRK